jgi:large subunit ribosomal protein L25
MEEIALNVQTRDGQGKGPARRLRQKGMIPGVFYGPKSQATSLAVDNKEFTSHVTNLEGSHLIRFQSSSTDLAQKVALVREVQVHPVSGSVLHVDFYEVDLTQRLQVTVPLHFVGKAAGLADGGILQPIIREIEVECLPTDIPQFIEVDVSALSIHDAIHLADLKLPENVTPVFENNEAVVSVLPPTVEEVKAAEPTEAAAEGAVPAEGAEAVAAKAAPAKEGAKEGGKETKGS